MKTPLFEAISIPEYGISSKSFREATRLPGLTSGKTRPGVRIFAPTRCGKTICLIDVLERQEHLWPKDDQHLLTPGRGGSLRLSEQAQLLLVCRFPRKEHALKATHLAALG
jgi:hypothetical protein